MEKLLQMQKQQVTWECKQGEAGIYRDISYVHQGHGEVEPVYSETLKRYRRGMCPCERAAEQEHKETQERKAYEQRRANLRALTFGWLGDLWADKELSTKTFMAFDEDRQPDAIAMIQCFLDDLMSGNQHGTLILYGPYGTGKTHLLAALCNSLHEQGKECLFASSVNLFGAIQDRIGRGESYVSLVNKAIHTPLLVLDDIDKAKHTDFREEIYFSIIDGRVKRELPTAISTNRLAELESFVGGAVWSRLKIGQIAIEMTGSDYREEL
jgi:DNA replication protein DnaC